MTDDEVSNLESFINNDCLAMAIATLTTADKMVLYHYYYSELNDVEISNRTGKTSQGVNKQRRRALAQIKKAYKNM